MFLTLLKIRLKAMLSSLTFGKRNGKKRSALATVGIAILLLYCVGVFAVLFFGMFMMICTPYVESGLAWLYFAFAGLLAFGLCFIGSIFATQSQLFESTDNELLLSMPIRPAHILASRLASLMLFNYFFAAIVFIPALVAYLIFFRLTALGVIAFVLMFLLLPLLAQTFSCAVAFIIALIGSKMRNKNLLTTILSILFLAAYFIGISKINDYITYLASNGAAMAAGLQNAAFPLYHAGLAVADGSILSLFIFILCAVIPFAVVCLLLSKNYIGITTTKKGAAKKKYVAKELKGSAPGRSILRIELSRFFSNSMYILNAGMGSIMALLLAVMSLIKMDGLRTAFAGLFESGLPLPCIMAGALCACTALNCISASSVSLEGKTIWITRSLPIDSFSILRAKAEAHVIASALPLILASVLCMISSGADLLQGVIMLLLPLTATVLMGIWGVLINLRFPKLDWINEMQPVKQGISVLVALLLGIGISIFVIVGMILLHYVLKAEVFSLILCAVFLLLSWLMYMRLKKSGVRKFESL